MHWPFLCQNEKKGFQSERKKEREVNIYEICSTQIIHKKHTR